MAESLLRSPRSAKNNEGDRGDHRCGDACPARARRVDRLSRSQPSWFQADPGERHGLGRLSGLRDREKVQLAAWPSGLGRGLQSPVPRFESGRRLQAVIAVSET
jgi:hypothetical protein